MEDMAAWSSLYIAVIIRIHANGTFKSWRWRRRWNSLNIIWWGFCWTAYVSHLFFFDKKNIIVPLPTHIFSWLNIWWLVAQVHKATLALTMFLESHVSVFQLDGTDSRASRRFRHGPCCGGWIQVHKATLALTTFLESHVSIFQLDSRFWHGWCINW